MTDGFILKYIGKSDSPVKHKKENKEIGIKILKKSKKDMKRTKNLKITPATHELLKKYCEKEGLKMFAFVEKLIKEKCKKPLDLYDED